jgi:DivIVA domain-containing protein
LLREDQLVTVFWVLLGMAVLCGVAVVAAGRGDGLAPADHDHPDLVLPDDRPVVREDVDRLRFSVGLRGYRMDEVDEVLDRLAADIALRDAHINELVERLAPHAHAPAQAANEAPVEEAPDVADAGRTIESAAFVSPVESESDLATARTLLVPLELFMGDRHAEPADEDQTDE